MKRRSILFGFFKYDFPCLTKKITKEFVELLFSFIVNSDCNVPSFWMIEVAINGLDMVGSIGGADRKLHTEFAHKYLHVWFGDNDFKLNVPHVDASSLSTHF